MDMPNLQPNRSQLVNALRDTAQSASNMVAENVSVPIDAIAWALRKAGVPVNKPMFGSDWMNEQGVTPKVEQSGAKVIGDTIGMLSPLGFTKQGAKALIDAGSAVKNMPVGMSIQDAGEAGEQMYRGVTKPWDEAARGDIEWWAPTNQHAGKYGIGGEVVSTKANTSKFEPLKESEYTTEKLNSLYSRSELDGVRVIDDSGKTVLFASFNKPKVTRQMVDK